MQGDGQGNVVQMDPHEITLFQLYQQQAGSANGRDRDDLPYTPEFDQLRNQFNQQTGRNDSHREFWLLLKYVLKYGIGNIARFLHAQGGGGGGQVAAGS
ncbi:MAG: hypothetical protein ACLP56_15915 [Candidatus Sulfotelmatobacter sp.]